MAKKNIATTIISLPASTTYDIWAYGVVVYEAIAGVPLSPYACRGKRSMTGAEICKIGMWDEHSVKKALKHAPEDHYARDLLRRLLHHDPRERFNSLRHVLEHPFFSGGGMDSSPTNALLSPQTSTTSQTTRSTRQSIQSGNYRKSLSDEDPPEVMKSESAESSVENRENGVSRSGYRSSTATGTTNNTGSPGSVASQRSFGGLRKLRSSLRRQTAA